VQARRFRARSSRFAALGAHVLGISSDPPGSHCRFAQAQRLPYLLLSDAGGTVRRSFGVATGMLGLLHGRATFAVGTDRIVRGVCTAPLRVGRHVRMALAALGAG
jgi:peroxiredoxin Q/BCP